MPRVYVTTKIVIRSAIIVPLSWMGLQSLRAADMTFADVHAGNILGLSSRNTPMTTIHDSTVLMDGFSIRGQRFCATSLYLRTYHTLQSNTWQYLHSNKTFQQHQSSWVARLSAPPTRRALQKNFRVTAPSYRQKQMLRNISTLIHLTRKGIHVSLPFQC